MYEPSCRDMSAVILSRVVGIKALVSGDYQHAALH